MHFCLYLYTHDFPTDKVIKQALAPYYEYAADEEIIEDRPQVIKWDGYVIGGRYGGKLQLRMNTEIGADKYEFGQYLKLRRAGRLFRHTLLERVALEMSTGYDPVRVYEDDVLCYMGARTGALWVDGAWIPDLRNLNQIADQAFCVIDADGRASARQTYTRGEWVYDEHFDDKLLAIADKNKNNCYLTVLDLHR